MTAAEYPDYLGGPDPFPQERAGDCPDTAVDAYYCTRDAGHPLPHVAMADRIVAVWPPFHELPFEVDQ